MRKILIIIAVFFSPALFAQDFITIDSCYSKLEKNYPLMKNTALIKEIVDKKLETLNTNYMPAFSINGQATWQSDVTKLEIDNPMLNFETPDISNDQYKITADVSQVIWDGGSTAVAKKIESISSEIERQQIKISMHNLKNQVNELYFTILILQEQINVLELTKAGISDRIKEVKAAVDNEMALKSGLNELKVSRLELEQQLFEAFQAIETTETMLELIIGEKIPELATYLLPAENMSPETELNRPELREFELRKKQIDAKKELLSRSFYPGVYGFGQIGYGRPGLNMLSDEFQAFAILGVKFSWSPWHWNKTKKEKQIADMNKKIIQNNKNSFIKQVNSEAEKYLNDAKVNQELMTKDEEIYKIRKDITQTKESQFIQGTITASEYLDALNKEAKAKVNIEIHKIKKSKAIINYLTVTGKF